MISEKANEHIRYAENCIEQFYTYDNKSALESAIASLAKALAVMDLEEESRIQKFEETQAQQKRKKR